MKSLHVKKIPRPQRPVLFSFCVYIYFFTNITGAHFFSMRLISIFEDSSLIGPIASGNVLITWLYDVASLFLPNIINCFEKRFMDLLLRKMHPSRCCREGLLEINVICSGLYPIIFELYQSKLSVCSCTDSTILTMLIITLFLKCLNIFGCNYLAEI